MSNGKEKEELQEKKPEIRPPIQIEKEEKKSVGLSSQIKELTEKIDIITETKKIKKEKKQFKIPYTVKSQLKKLAKKNKVQVILCQHNKNIMPTIGELKEGMLIVGDKIHEGSSDGIWLWNGKIPTAIVFEWDLKPLTSEGMYYSASKDKRISHPQAIMIRAMELKEAMQGTKKISGKVIIWVVIAAIVGGYILFANKPGG